MAQEKTIMGSLTEMQKAAGKVKVGNVGVLTDEQGYAIVLKYFGIKATGSKSTQSVTSVPQKVTEGSISVTQEPKTEIKTENNTPNKRFTASLDEFF